jgi:hypothetical protein
MSIFGQDTRQRSNAIPFLIGLAILRGRGVASLHILQSFALEFVRSQPDPGSGDTIDCHLNKSPGSFPIAHLFLSLKDRAEISCCFPKGAMSLFLLET